MIMSLIVIGIVGGLAYSWASRGFFSAMLAMACTIAAGAIAFAVWEPLAYLMLEKVPERGFFVFLRDVAWGVTLGLPFAVALAVLRIAVDKAVPANAETTGVADYVGGGICGAVTGVIAAGVLVMSLGFLRMSPAIMGYQAVGYSNDSTARGAIARESKLWLPADTWTATLYGFMSEKSLNTGNPLAREYPDLELVGGTMRMTYDEGTGRNTLRRRDVQLTARYVVGENEPMNELLKDQWNKDNMGAVDIDGEAITSGHVEGYIVQFNPGAKEKGGQTVISPGQVRLVVENDENHRRTLHPAAVLCQSAADNPSFGRFLFNSRDIHIASVGGASQVLFAFEFAIPNGYEAVSFYVKNIRIQPESQAITPEREYATPSDRDAQLSSDLGIPPFAPEIQQEILPGQDEPLNNEAFSVSNGIGRTIQKGTEGSLKVDADNDNKVIDGENSWYVSKMPQAGGLSRNLKIQKYLNTNDTVIVQADLTEGTAISTLDEPFLNASLNAPIELIDQHGTPYQAVGYYYEDEQVVTIRFTPARPLTGLSDAPALSRSKRGQRLKLIFRCSIGVELVKYRIGDVVMDLDEPIVLDTNQR